MKVRTVKQRQTTPLTLVKSAILASSLWFASYGTAMSAEWRVNLQDADIRAFINEVASITDKNFSIDPRVNGKVTVISNQPMNEDEIYELFLSVMEVNGVAAVNRGSITILEPDNIAKQSGLPVDINSEFSGQQMVTRVVYLQNTQPSEILSVIRPLMPTSAHAAVVPSVNAMVLSDKANSLNQLELLIKSLDGGSDSTLEIIPLRHTDAERMMELISELAIDDNRQKSSTGKKLKIIADSSSDRLLVTGHPEKIATIKAMVSRLDTLPSKSFGGMKVFQLNYSEAAHIANILKALIAKQSISSSESSANVSTASLNSGSKNSSKNSGKGNSANKAKQQRRTGKSAKKGGSASGDSDSSGHKFSIIADETRNALYVSASSQTMAEIDSFIKEIDVPDVQILIQAAVIEVSGDDMQQLGVQWALGNNNSGYGVVNFNNVGTTATGLATSVMSKNPVAISSAAGSIAGALLGIGDSKKEIDDLGNVTSSFYGAILQAIDKTSNANLLSTPSITTLNHKEASLLVGQNVPFVTGSFSNSGGDASPFQTVDRQDVGIQLNVIPHVGPDGVVKLDVSQEVSSVVEGSTSNISGLITNKSFIDTTVMARSGQTIALGGLMREKNSQSQQKIPKLGDTPLIGRLFRSDDQSSQKSNLIIFLQPTVLKNGGIVPSITERDGDRIKIMQLSIEPNGSIRQIPLTNSNQYYANQQKSTTQPTVSSSKNDDWYRQNVNIPKTRAIMPVSPWASTDSVVQKLLPTGFSQVADTSAVKSKNEQPKLSSAKQSNNQLQTTEQSKKQTMAVGSTSTNDTALTSAANVQETASSTATLAKKSTEQKQQPATVATPVGSTSPVKSTSTSSYTNINIRHYGFD